MRVARRVRLYASSTFHRADLREVVFDPWNDKGVTNHLTNDGFTCVEVRQTYSGMSAFTKGFLDSLAAGNLRQGIRFCAGTRTA